MRVELDLDRCCGTGQCALTAPAVFEQSDDTGLAVLRLAVVPPEHADAAREAAENCTVQAIRTIEN